MNLLSVSYGKVCSATHQLRNWKANEKHLLSMANCFSMKNQFLKNETFVHWDVSCYYAILYFFAHLT